MQRERPRRHRGAAAASDILGIDALLSDDERAVRDRVRAFVDAEIRPHIADWFDRAHFPAELAPAFGELGVLGMNLEGYGCPGRSAVEYGLAALELEAGDSGLRTFVSVQGSLAMGSIHRWGSEEQKQEWLPRMARGEVIGSFGLTEPGAGSDPASMKTFARRDGDDWVLTGSKRWIGLASIAQLTVVWAQTDDGVRGFIVPTDATGFRTTRARAEAVDARVDPVPSCASTTCGCRPPRSFPVRAACGGRSRLSTRPATGSCGAPSARAATATRLPFATRSRASSSTGRSRGSSSRSRSS